MVEFAPTEATGGSVMGVEEAACPGAALADWALKARVKSKQTLNKILIGLICDFIKASQESTRVP